MEVNMKVKTAPSKDAEREIADLGEALATAITRLLRTQARTWACQQEALQLAASLAQLRLGDVKN